MRLTLCIDALQPQLSGIGRYTWELCQRLPSREEISDLRFYAEGALIADPVRRLTAESAGGRSPNRLVKRLRRARTKQVLRSSLVHGPNYFLPPEVEGGVITVHDLSVERYPETHPPERVAAFERLFASSLRRAAHVIADTETVRQELIRDHSLDPGRVSAVNLGVSAAFRPMEVQELAGTIRANGLTADRYGLSVAAFEPRKRIGNLIAAWGRLPPTVREQFPLVLAGNPGWRNDALHQQIASAERAGWLKNLGYVHERDLPALYAGARLFLYPSIYEGFGLPPVEAMASGTPVIVANRSCLPEVCGDAARYIDPDDVHGLTDVIHESLLDNAWRSETTARGLKRSRKYSWERCVDDTVTVYANI